MPLRNKPSAQLKALRGELANLQAAESLLRRAADRLLNLSVDMRTRLHEDIMWLDLTLQDLAIARGRTEQLIRRQELAEQQEGEYTDAGGE